MFPVEIILQDQVIAPNYEAKENDYGLQSWCHCADVRGGPIRVGTMGAFFLVSFGSNKKAGKDSRNRCLLTQIS